MKKTPLMIICLVLSAASALSAYQYKNNSNTYGERFRGTVNNVAKDEKFFRKTLTAPHDEPSQAYTKDALQAEDELGRRGSLEPSYPTDSTRKSNNQEVDSENRKNEKNEELYE